MRGGSRWPGCAIGFAFLTKMMQALLVLPAFALVYLLAAPTSLRRAVRCICSARGGAVIVSAGWYVALVELWPAGSPALHRRVDRTTRCSSSPSATTGSAGSSVARATAAAVAVAGGGNTGFGGAAGIGRMFGAAFGTEISWLLPAALIALVAGLWFTRRAPRTDRTGPRWCCGAAGCS